MPWWFPPSSFLVPSAPCSSSSAEQQVPWFASGFCVHFKITLDFSGKDFGADFGTVLDGYGDIL